jgi:hypothetical protein
LEAEGLLAVLLDEPLVAGVDGEGAELADAEGDGFSGLTASPEA